MKNTCNVLCRNKKFMFIKAAYRKYEKNKMSNEMSPQLKFDVAVVMKSFELQSDMQIRYNSMYLA